MRPSRPSLNLLLLFLLLATGAAHGDSLTDGNRLLARQITTRVGAGSAISLVASNLSSLGEKQFDQLQRDLLTQLRAQGMTLTSASESVAEVRATLSENVHGYLWVAQIRQGPRAEVVMLPMERAGTAAAASPSAALVLRKTLLWSQDEAILDLAVLPSGDGRSHVLVLEPSRIALYDAQRGAMEGSVAVPQPGPWPRDLRGRLLLRRERLFDAYLPGTSCSSAGQSISSAQCRSTDDPWPLGGDEAGPSAFFSPSRNFFTGILSGTARGKSVAPFFSAARLEGSGQELWLLAGVDGVVRFFNGSVEAPAGVRGWGSDVAALKTDCGGGWQVLASRAGDSNVPDAVQAYEITGRELAPVSPPVEFGGPVTALWPASDRSSAVAVARNLATGRYEAFALAISCSR